MAKSALFLESNDQGGTIDLRIENCVAHVTINWPEKRNAMRYTMWAAVADVFETIRYNDSLAAVVVGGAGMRAFAAGADIQELASCLNNREKALAYMAMAEAAVGAIATCPHPVIAAIRGYCIGAGLEIAMACDIRLATIASEFAAPPAKLGANYSFDSTRRLLRLVGPGAARRMLFTGWRLSAEEAARAGLIEYCGEEIETELLRLTETLIGNSPYSIGVAKKTLAEIEKGATSETSEIRELRLAGFTDNDLCEGISSFLQKRTPRFRSLERSRRAKA